MDPAKHDPPAYVGAFEVRREGDGYVLVTDRVVAHASTGPGRIDFVGTDDVTRGDFAVVARMPEDPAAGYDVLDSRGDAIAFFRIEDDILHLHSPSLDATADLADPLALTWYDRVVLRVEHDVGRYVVATPDRRVDVRVAAALVVVVGPVMGS